MNIAQHLFSLTLGLTGLLYIPGGLWLWKKPPAKISRIYGYRTPRSMKSQAAWDFAQVYAGKALCCCGIALTCLALLSLPFTLAQDISTTIAVLVVLVFTALPVYLTERNLKLRFGQQQ
ncbi:SdpI family protein [uncultured Chitinophaga sp.]|jgi:hypothetical protein|uniref:SdpI family protein n=1 Tax=uncultured Chitinophaga sp. TaxID=339340 RepID=UPI002602BCBF|nr:SdpI family protein [uncultured Chitinophaga sp.]